MKRLDEAHRDLRSQHHWISSEPNDFAGKICTSDAFLERDNIDDLESTSGFILSRERNDYGMKALGILVAVAT